MAENHQVKKPQAVVRLHVGKIATAANVLYAVVVLAFCIAAVAFVGAIFVVISKAAVYVAWAIGAVLCILAGRSAFQRAFKKRSLLLFDDRLEIHHPEVFESPPVIDKENIAHIAVEYRSRRALPLEGAQAFPIHDIDDAIYPGESGYLYDRDRGNPIPLICSAGDIPNLAVLFHQPYRFTTTKRFKAAAMATDKYRMHLQFPNRVDDIMGFLTRVANPRKAEETFKAWGTGTGKLSAELGRRAFPDPGTYNFRLNRGAAIAGVGITLAYLIGRLIERYVN